MRALNSRARLAFVTTGTRRAWRILSNMPLLVGVVVAQVVIAAALRLMPLSSLWTRLAGARDRVQSLVHARESQVIWAIDATGARLRGISTCLVRALVAEILLGSPGRPLSFAIGVRHGTNGALEAHAWVARGDRVIVGAQIAGDYAPLLEWNSTAISLTAITEVS
jgi:hypothetical protein